MQGKLLVTIIGLWLIFGLVYHTIIMQIFNNQLFYCLLLFLILGLINYFVIYIYRGKYYNLCNSNKMLQNSLDLDALTGLFNRAAFEKHMFTMDETELYSMIFADIDNFRNFNNYYGHDIGDMVLQKVSEMINSTVRSVDRVYRYGGEEIIVLLKDCNKEDAINIAEKIRLNVMNMDNEPFPNVTISLGVSTFPEDSDDIKQIIKASDSALLNAKNSGKNCTWIYQKN